MARKKSKLPALMEFSLEQDISLVLQEVDFLSTLKIAVEIPDFSQNLQLM